MKRILLSTIFFFCISLPVWAFQSQSTNDLPSGLFVGLNSGLTFPEVTNHNYVASGGGWPYDRFAYHYIEFASLISGEAGYSLATNMKWVPMLSLSGNYTYAFPSTVHGRINQYSLYEFENYAFKYQIQRQTLLAIIKADLVRWNCLMPYFAVGLGMSFNKASGYNEVPLPGVTPRLSPDFNRKTSKVFAYTVGAGIDIITTNNLIIGVEYNYGDFGHADTRHGNNGYASEKLPTKLKANTILMNLNYYFGNRFFG